MTAAPLAGALAGNPAISSSSRNSRPEALRPRLATGLPLRCGSSGPRNEARDNCQQPPTLCSLREQNTGYSTIVIRSNELPYGNEGDPRCGYTIVCWAARATIHRLMQARTAAAAARGRAGLHSARKTPRAVHTVPLGTAQPHLRSRFLLISSLNFRMSSKVRRGF